jgi:lipoate-protein ligase B
LNVDLDLESFSVIRPCGFDLPVTSIAQLAGTAPGVEQVGWLVGGEFARVLGLKLSGSAMFGRSIL